MLLDGASQAKVLAHVAPIKGAWRSRRGLELAIRNEEYVRAGVRSIETQQRLRELYATNFRKQAFGSDRRHTTQTRDHEFAGLIACGQCVAAGYDAKDCRMTGRYIMVNPNPFNLVCDGKRGGTRVHAPTMIAVHLLLLPLIERLEKLRDPRVAEAVLERWQQEPLTDKFAKLRVVLEARLAATDDEEAALDARVNAAFRLMESGRIGVIAEAERVLEPANSDRLTLRAQRAALTQQFADLPLPVRRTVHVGSLLYDAENLLTTAGRRDALKRWVDTIAPPIWYGRKQRKQGAAPRFAVDLRWPFLDDVRPQPAPDYDVPVHGRRPSLYLNETRARREPVVPARDLLNINK